MTADPKQPLSSFSAGHRRGGCTQDIFLDIAKVTCSLGKESGLFKILCEDAGTSAVGTAGTAQEILATSR